MKYTGFALSDEDKDPLFEDASKFVIENDNASASFLQRKMSLGYARCARLLDELQMAGVVGPADGSKPREIFFKQYEEYQLSQSGHLKSLEASTIEKKDYKVPEIHLSTPEEILWGQPLSSIKPIPLTIPFGFDNQNQLVSIPIDKLDHLLITGNPQGKKMEFLDTLILSQLLCATPQQLNLILVDESNYLNLYKNLPHLLSPVINEPDKALSALKWAQTEIVRRQRIFSNAGVRNYDSYRPLPGVEIFPQVLIIVRLFDHDQMFDYAYTQITSYGHLTGVHLIMVVDQASGTFISSQVKANIPNRLVFRTTSLSDSSTAGVRGAEKLGIGQAILKVADGAETQINTVYTSEDNVKEILESIQKAN
jgi:S-DNA-T family DNA segregation ATPase FtsK/SpoIIIE